MHLGAGDVASGLHALRLAVLEALRVEPALATATPSGPFRASTSAHVLMSDHVVTSDSRPTGSGSPAPGGYDDSSLAASSEEDAADRERLIALVELARQGDKDAFGLLFDHYHPSVYRFVYYRTRSPQVAEDLASETFFRALRSMNNFRWQGKDFGAWLMTIARNLTTDHFKAGRTRLEHSTEDMGAHDDTTEGPETAVLAQLTNETLLSCLQQLPKEQQECLVMRFLQSMSIAETAAVLGRSEGAIKQLQLRGVRNLAKLMPEGVRD